MLYDYLSVIMASNIVNLRTKVNMLVQKGQLPEPVVRFVFLDSLRWHCYIDMVIAGKTVQADAEAPTKAEAHELALASFKLPAVRAAKTVVPPGCWMFTVDEDEIDVSYTAPSGALKIETIKNTSNIFTAMQKIAKSD